MNLRSILLVCIAALPAFHASCASSSEEERRRETGRRLEALQRMEHRKALIRSRALEHDVAGSARVHFPRGGVIVEIVLRPSREQDGEARQERLARLRRLQEDLNAYIENLTGCPREAISLRVRPAD